MRDRFVRFVVLAALAAILLQTSGAARQDVSIGPVDNVDIRHDKERVAAYAERVAADRSASLAALTDARVNGLARLQQSYATLDVLPNAAVGTLEVVGKAPGTGFLTAPSSDRVGALRGFLSGYADAFGLSAEQVSELTVVGNYVNPAGNLAWVELEQRVNGLPVFQGTMRGGFTARGELVRTTGLLAGGIDPSSLASAPSIGAPQAIALAAAGVGWNVDETQITQRTADAAGHLTFTRASMAGEPKAWLLYFPLAPGVLRLAWATEVWGDPMAYLAVIDAADGTLLFRKNLTAFQAQNATYVIYNDDSPAPMSPSTALPGTNTQAPSIGRTTVTLIGNEEPNIGKNDNGWITDGGNTTDGNNVQAGIDVDGTDGIDAGGTATGSPSRVFDFAYDPAVDAPSTLNYRKGEVTNMFYWTNVYHDRLYELGFTEAARNFQNDNFGRGGVAGDRISAEAQDSSSTNNANFSTPADGGRGRMQMFVFPGPNPDRSSGLDQDVMLHELTHGTSNRLHANGSGLNSSMSRGMGEGWSDFYARALLSSAGEDVNAIYSTGGWVTNQFWTSAFTDNYYYGIRRFPYAVKTNVGTNGKPHNPLTFADLDSTQANVSDGAFSPGFSSTLFDEVHNAGEIWAMALFEVRARFINRLGYATGNQRILQFVTDAMKLDPVDPTMLQGRDTLLAVAAASGTSADIDDVWAGFATRGMGFSAKVTNAGGANGNNTTRVVEAFDLPGVRATSAVLQTESIPNGRLDPGETVGVQFCMTNDATTTTNTVTGTLLAGGGVASPSAPQSYGNINPGANACNTFTFTVSASCGATITPSLQAVETSGPTRTLAYTMTVGGPVPSFTQNFDGVTAPALPVGWSTSTLFGTANPWSTNTLAASSAPNRVFASNRGTASDSVLVSPTIALPAGLNRLSFRHFYSLDADQRSNVTAFYDGGVLEISINGGGFQDVITAGGTFVSGGYNATLTNYSGNTNPLVGRQAWTATSSGYVTTAVDLPSAAGGQNIALRWRLASDPSIAFFGWAIDDISIGQFSCASLPPAPTAANDSYSTPFNTPLNVTAPGVLGNDTGTGPLTAALVANVAHGGLALASDGSFTYTPTTGYSGPDSFTYTANNAGGASNVATVNLTVNAAPSPPAPVAANDAFATPFNTPVSVAAPGVLSNDSGTGPITAVLVANVTHGTLALAANGGFTYTPTTGYSGPDAFAYTANNAGGASNLATVALTVNPAPPVGVQPPAGLHVAFQSGNTITLAWTPPSTGPVPAGYILEGGLAHGEVIASLPLSPVPSVTLTAPNGTFFLRVHTLAGADRSVASNEIQIFVNTPTAPSAPADLVGLVNGSAVSLAWRNTFDGGTPTSVVLDVTGTLSATVPLALSDTFSFPNMPNGTYTFRVRGANAAGVSPPSSPVTLSFPGPCTGVPQAPVNFTFFKVGTTLNLFWDPPTAGPAPQGYVLNVTGAFVGSVPVGTSHMLSAPVGPGTYNVSVQAVNACGAGGATAVSTVVVP